MEYHVRLSTQQPQSHRMCIMCRSPAHCIEYAHLIQWGRDRPDEEFDADTEEHMKWMYKHALARAQEFGIQASPAAHLLHSLLAIMPCTSAACCHPTCAVTGMCTLSFCCSCMSMSHLLSTYECQKVCRWIKPYFCPDHTTASCVVHKYDNQDTHVIQQAQIDTIRPVSTSRNAYLQ